jgi:GNAT superfamily N-acetyltransferase
LSEKRPSFVIRDATIADAPALADCVIAPMVTTFRGLVPAQCLDWLTRDESITNWQRWFSDEEESVLLVAEHETAGVVGVALGGPQPEDRRYSAELFLLGVLLDYHRQGIGRALVQSVAARLRERGLYALRVLMLAINPHRGFYERLGARELWEQPYDWNGVRLTAVVYGWEDSAILQVQ